MKKLILLLLCSLFISCFKEPKNINSDVKKEVVRNDSVPNINSNVIKIQKKFAYVVIQISKPVLYGEKSNFIDIPSICYAKYVVENNSTDIIELESYNEDIKYQLLDGFESRVKEKYKGIGTSLYLEAFDKYGSREAEEIKNAEYNIKILSRDIFVFDSYSEASKHKNN
jgi:hypothetical protein